MSYRLRMNSAALAMVAGLCSSAAPGAVVINEVMYDEAEQTSTDVVPDTREFVELYNNGSEAVDIGGWQVSLVALDGSNTITDTINAGTMIAPGGYFVLGAAAVPNVNQVITPDPEIYLDTNQMLELRNSGGGLIDALAWETARDPQLTNVSAEQLAQIGGGFYGGNQQSLNTTYPITLGRLRNGNDTNVNGRDFGQVPLTPGAHNGLTLQPNYAIPDVDGLTVFNNVPGFRGSFFNARVIDPTVADASILKRAVPASPQGGKAIIAWDQTGGGNMILSEALVHEFDLYAYLDTTFYDAAGSTTIAGAESQTYGIGSTGVYYNWPDPTGLLFNNTRRFGENTGIGWLFEKEDSQSLMKLHLIDFNDGGDSSPAAEDWEIITSIDLTGVAPAWHRLSIDYDPATGNVVAKFDGQTFNFTTITDLTGTFYVGYRESLTGTPADLMPAIFDMVASAPVVDADFDNVNGVDGGDVLIWQQNLGISDGSATNADGDANGDGNVTAADLTAWVSQFGAGAAVLGGAVPEPASGLSSAATLLAWAAVRRRRRATR